MSATMPQAALPKELLPEFWPDLAARLELRPFGTVCPVVLLVGMRGGDFGPLRLRRVFAGRLQAIDPQEVLRASEGPKAMRLAARPNG
jgi:hypothetical protein